MNRAIHALVRRGSAWVAECYEAEVVTQVEALDETIVNLQGAVGLHVDGEDLAEPGLGPEPVLSVTVEAVRAVHAA